MNRHIWLIMLGLVLNLVWTSLRAQIVTMATNDFAYTGDKGPDFWQEITPMCASTAHSRQSPIDFAEVKVDPNLKPLQVISADSVTTLTNLGYTIMATPAIPATMVLNGTAYMLKEFHFHTLSEHTVLKQHGVMELHAVFANATESKLAVIGVIYKLGNSNPFLQKLLVNKLPQKTTSPPGNIGRHKRERCVYGCFEIFQLSRLADNPALLRECGMVCTSKVCGIIGRSI